VVFCNVSPAEKLVSTISIDYQRGIAQAIEHIVGLGHRRAAVIAGPDDNGRPLQSRTRWLPD